MLTNHVGSDSGDFSVGLLMAKNLSKIKDIKVMQKIFILRIPEYDEMIDDGRNATVAIITITATMAVLGATSSALGGTPLVV